MKNWKTRLKKGIYKLKNILSGKSQITNRLKFHALIGSIASVHVFLLVIFGIFRVMPLFYFNIFSVSTYAFCFWLMRGEREHYLAIYFITYGSSLTFLRRHNLSWLEVWFCTVHNCNYSSGILYLLYIGYQTP